MIDSACRCGWFSILWINSRTLTLCNCFTVECGSPGILKSMSSSILSRVNSLSVLSIVISRCTSGTSCRSILCLSGCPDRSWVCSTRMFSDRLFWALITLGVISGCPDRSEEQSSSWKHFSSISWERDVSPLTTNTSCVLSGCPDRSQIGFGIGWVSWENVACLETSPRDCRTTFPSGCWSTVEPNGTSPLVQSWRNEIFGGGRGDMYDFSFKTAPVSILTTLEYNELEVFLEGWLHSIESDRMLIPLWSQDQYQPRIRRLDVSSMRCASIVHDVVHSSQFVQDLCALCLWDQQAKRILSVSCLNSDLQVSIHCWW